MTEKQARALRPPDPVLWTWPNAPNKPPTAGVVKANTDLDVRIKWKNQPGEDTLFALTDSSAWKHVSQNKPATTAAPSKNGRAKNTPRKKKRK